MGVELCVMGIGGELGRFCGILKARGSLRLGP